MKNQHEYYGFIWLPKDIEWYKGNILEIFDEIQIIIKNVDNNNYYSYVLFIVN